MTCLQTRLQTRLQTYHPELSNINSGVCVCRRVCRQVCRQIISNVCQFRLFRPFMDPTPFSTLPPPKKKSICPPPICSGSSTQFASTSELEKVTMPIDGSANSLNILLTALTDGILDMVGTESILVMFFGR